MKRKQWMQMVFLVLLGDIVFRFAFGFARQRRLLAARAGRSRIEAYDL